MSGRHRRRAFTLIEFLAVVVILLVLAAMVFPAYSGSRRSLITSCMSKQRQLILTATIYANDCGGRFPNLDASAGNDGPVALSLLAKYVGNQTNIFMCPAVERDREKSRCWYQRRFVPQFNPAFFASNGNDYAYYDGLAVSTNVAPLLADRGVWTARTTNLSFLNHPQGIAVAAFTDGHAQMLKREMTVGTNLTPPWSAVQDPLLKR